MSENRSMATNTPATRNLAAEVRAVEEGHRARLDGASLVVTSDTHHGKQFRVHATTFGPGSPVQFVCTPEGDGAFRNDHGRRTSAPGVCGCKHAALAARRLEREGLAVLVDGQWVGSELARSEAEVLADPFAGLVPA